MGEKKSFPPKIFLFNKKGKSGNKYLLALDIGTEFVKAVILKTDKQENSQFKTGSVIGFSQQRQKPGNMLAGAVANIQGVVDVCQTAITQASKIAKVLPEKTVMGVAGEFVKGITVNFAYKRSKPNKEIDVVELQNILQKIQWKAFDRTRSHLAWETGRPEIEIKPINSLITETRIDGYQITNPIGFRGKEIFFSIFNVYAPIVHLKALEGIAERLNLNLLSIVAESYALTRTVEIDSAAGAIFIDIGGGTTDIALVRQGKIEGIKSLSLAGQSFTKRVGQGFDLNIDLAEEIKLMYANKGLSRQAHSKLRHLLEQDTRIWLDGIELVLEEFGQKEAFPANIFLCGGGSLLPLIKSILKRDSTIKRWKEKFSLETPFMVEYINLENIKQVQDKTGQLNTSQSIAPLALAGLGLEIISEEEKVLSPILRRVIRLMR